jgi:hypothetical protein
MKIVLCHRIQPLMWGRPSIMTRLLRSAGHDVTEIQDGPLHDGEDSILWIQDSAAWFPEVRRQLRARAARRRPFTVVWHSEPLPPSRASGLPAPRLDLREIAKVVLRDRRATDVYTNLRVLRELSREGIPDLLVVSSRGRQQRLSDEAIRSHHVPLGSFDGMGGPLGIARDIDVLFLGSLNVARRNRLLSRLVRAGVPLTSRGGWSDPGCWGDSRTRLLNRSRILLNFARTPGEYSGVRLLLGMVNRCLVISEPIHEPGPVQPGVHYVSAGVDEMPGVIRHYLDRPAEAARIAERGHELATTELTMERSVGRILELIRDGR